MKHILLVLFFFVLASPLFAEPSDFDTELRTFEIPPALLAEANYQALLAQHGRDLPERGGDPESAEVTTLLGGYGGKNGAIQAIKITFNNGVPDTSSLPIVQLTNGKVAIRGLWPEVLIADVEDDGQVVVNSVAYDVRELTPAELAALRVPDPN